MPATNIDYYFSKLATIYCIAFWHILRVNNIEPTLLNLLNQSKTCKTPWLFIILLKYSIFIFQPKIGRSNMLGSGHPAQMDLFLLKWLISWTNIVDLVGILLSIKRIRQNFGKLNFIRGLSSCYGRLLEIFYWLGGTTAKISGTIWTCLENSSACLF